MEKLRFMHIPKTAGSTFTSILNFQYLSQEKTSFIFKGDITTDTKNFYTLSEIEKQNIIFIGGHVPITTGIEEVDQISTIITFLRDPISRVKSFIQHVSEGKSPNYLTKPFNLDNFLASGLSDLSNLQTKMLINNGIFQDASLLNSMSSSSARDTALNNLFNKISQFGIQEYFDESVLLFANRFNWYIPFYTNRNTKNNEFLVEFSQSHLDHIAELNGIDIEVYNAAKTKFLNIFESSYFHRVKSKIFKHLNSTKFPISYRWYIDTKMGIKNEIGKFISK